MSSGWGALRVAVDFLVVYPSLGEGFLILMEVADFNQCRPDFHGGMDHANDIIHNTRDILLEKIGFKPVEGSRQIFGE